MKTANGIGVAIILAALASGNCAIAQDAANAAQPRVIDITAKKYEFSPAEVHVRRGEAVVIRLHSIDRVHGFFSRLLHVDADVPTGGTFDAPIDTAAAGEYVVICDHYCGPGHGNMNMKVVVDN